MVIAKPIYEPLPFAYLLTAVGLIYWLDNPLVLASAILFYCAGAIIWVQRSVFRRNQRIIARNGRSHIKTRPDHAMVNLPEAAYEMLPFIYIGTGLLIFYFQPGRLGLLLAVLCCFAGSLALAMRSTNRHRR